MDNKIFRFELSSDDVKIKKILGKEFLEIEVWGISDAYPNNNDSHFTIDSMTEALPTFKNKPCLGAFNTVINDFKAHEGKIALDKELQEWYWDTANGGEIPLGVIREQDKVEIKKKEDLNWIVFTCALWTQYNYRQVKRLLKSKTKKISVEIMATKTHFDENNIEVIDEFIFNGFTILGDNVGCGIEGAHLTILDKLDDVIFSQKVAGLQFACEKLNEIEQEEKCEEASFEDDEDNKDGHEDDKDDKDNKDDNKDDNQDDGKEEYKKESEGINDISSSFNKIEDDLYINKNVSEEGGNTNLLTYREKQKLLESAITIHYETDDDNWFYVCDLDEFNVYVCTEIGTFKYTYQIAEAEEKYEVQVDFDSGVQVIQTWKEFEEETDGGNEEEENKFEENSEVPENKEVFEDKEGSNEPNVSENSIIEAEYEALKVQFEDLKAEYEASKENFAKMQEELEVFKVEKRKAENEAFSDYAKTLVYEEDALTSEDVKKEIFETVSEKCINGEFENTESIKDYLENILAKAVYAEIKKHKESKIEEKVENKENSQEEKEDNKETPKEFSVPITKKVEEPVSEQKKSSFEILSDFNEN